MTKLLDAAEANTTSSNYKLVHDDILLSAYGSFDGESITLQHQTLEGTWVDITDGVFSSTEQKKIQLSRGLVLRAVVSNGGGSPSVHLWLLGRD